MWVDTVEEVREAERGCVDVWEAGRANGQGSPVFDDHIKKI